MIYNCRHCRAESAHSKLKKQLGSSQGTFETCWIRIHALLEGQHSSIKASFEKSKNVVQHQYNKPLFKILRGMVSDTALGKISKEMDVVNVTGIDPLLCGCILRKTCGLPCAHEIGEYVRMGMPIPLDAIDRHWKKLDMDPITGVDLSVSDDVGCRWSETVCDVNNIFSMANESEKLLMLKRLKEIANPTTTSLLEPQVNIRTRGRPRNSKAKVDKSTRRDPSRFEYVESNKDSCSPHDNIFVVSHPISIDPIAFTVPSRTGKQKQQVIEVVF